MNPWRWSAPPPLHLFLPLPNIPGWQVTHQTQKPPKNLHTFGIWWECWFCWRCSAGIRLSLVVWWPVSSVASTLSACAIMVEISFIFFLFQQNLPAWTWGCICMHHLPPLMQWLCKAYILETIFLLFVVVGILASLEQTMLQCWFCLLPLVDVARCCWRKMLVGCWSILMKIRTECCCWLLPEHILGC